MLGDEVGAFVRRVHEGKGVAFRLGRKPAKITADAVVLDDGSELPATLVVMGVGVRAAHSSSPRRRACTIDRGVVVDDAAARGARRLGGGRHRALSVATASSCGSSTGRSRCATARRSRARCSACAPRRDVPFFWSQHHDVTLGYVGHAERFDRAEVHGDLDARDAHVVYRDGGAIRAVVTLGRDKLALDVELAFERDDAAALEAAVR